MKTLTAAAIAAALFAVSPAAAEESKIALSDLTCKQFTAYNDDNKGFIVTWLEGYYMGDNDDAVIDFGKMAGDMAHLMVYCGDHPDSSMEDAADEVMGE